MADNVISTQCDDEDSQQGQALLSQDLERRLIVTRKEIDGFIGEVDSGNCSIEQYNCIVSTIHASRAELLNARMRLEKFTGFSVEDSTAENLAHYEYASVKILADINNRLSAMRSESQLEPRELQAQSTTENEPKTYTAQNQAATSARPIAEQCTDIDVQSEVSTATEGLEIGQTAYGTQLAAVVPRKIARKSRSKTSKQSSASSTAMKLKLRTEEAELTINQQFDDEMTDRAQRQLSRNAKKERERWRQRPGEKKKGGGREERSRKAG